jgi:hypothetical protein
VTEGSTFLFAQIKFTFAALVGGRQVFLPAGPKRESGVNPLQSPLP